MNESREPLTSFSVQSQILQTGWKIDVEWLTSDFFTFSIESQEFFRGCLLGELFLLPGGELFTAEGGLPFLHRFTLGRLLSDGSKTTFFER